MKKVFLCHSSKDKILARRLGNDLKQYNIKVWIDEAEIKVGDSLIGKISEGLSDADFIIALISKSSCESKWVKRELKIAMKKESSEINNVIMPCLIDDCIIPDFLEDRRLADFRTTANYVNARSELIRSIGVQEKSDSHLFLDQHIFYDLFDLNDGFDVEAIRYFSKEDFNKVLDRAEFFDLSILGIEPWPEKQFYGVEVYEDYSDNPSNSKWYRDAFNKFVENGVESYYSASYDIPDKVLKVFKHRNN